MRAWRPSAGGLVACELDAPVPGPDQLVVRVQGATLGRAQALASDPAITPGGAAVGTVIATGDAATHLDGKRVLVSPRSPCGECDLCRRGAAAVCPHGQFLGVDADGALAEQLVTRARWVCPLEDGLDHERLAGPETAAVAGDLADGYAMYARAGVAPGEPVIITGDGARSRLLFDIAVSRGTKPLVVTDDADWIEQVRSRGGSPQPDRGDDLPASMIESARAAGLGERPWRVFDAEGEPRTRQRALTLARPAATIVLSSGPGATGAAAVDLEPLVAQSCTVIGVAGAHPDLLVEAAALVVRGDVDLAARVQVHPVADLEQVRARVAAAGSGARAQVIAVSG